MIAADTYVVALVVDVGPPRGGTAVSPHTMGLQRPLWQERTLWRQVSCAPRGAVVTPRTSLAGPDTAPTSEFRTFGYAVSPDAPFGRMGHGPCLRGVRPSLVFDHQQRESAMCGLALPAQEVPAPWPTLVVRAPMRNY